MMLGLSLALTQPRNGGGGVSMSDLDDFAVFRWDMPTSGALYQSQAGDGALADDAAEAVGFVVDQAQGAALGSELRGTGATANLNGIAGTYDTSTGAMSVTYNNSSSQGQVAFTGLSQNTWYRIELASVAGGRIGARTASGGASVTPTFVNVGTSGVIHIFTGSSTTIWLATDVVGTSTCTVSSFRSLAGLHGYQTTAGNRPLVVDNGGRRHIRFDGSNDALSVTLPSAVTNATLVLAGTYGIHMETVSLAAGAHTFGGSTWAAPGSSIAGILRAIGDVVGIAYYNLGSLSTDQRDAILRHYQAQGAGGLLEEGAELITNGDGSTTTGWTATTATLSSVSGQLRVTGTASGVPSSASQSFAGYTAGVPFLMRGTATRQNADASQAQVSAYDSPPHTSSIAPTNIVATAGTAIGTPVTGAVAFVAPADGAFSVAGIITSTTAVGALADFDDISLRRLIPAALL